MAGLLFHVVIPGVGVVLHDAGIEIFDENYNTLFAKGTFDWLVGDFDTLCAALANAAKPEQAPVTWGNVKKLQR